MLKLGTYLNCIHHASVFSIVELNPYLYIKRENKFFKQFFFQLLEKVLQQIFFFIKKKCM